MTNVYLPNQIPLRIPYSPLKGFNHIKPIRISGTSTKLTDYQVKIELTRYNFPFEKCRSDGADIRIIDEDNSVLNYWLESWSSTSKTATIWCKIPEIPIEKDKSLWMIYGNPSASSTSSGINTFDYFGDFDSYTDGTLNGQGGWTATNYNVQSTVVKDTGKAIAHTNNAHEHAYVSINETTGIFCFYVRQAGTNEASYFRLQESLTPGNDFAILLSSTSANIQYRDSAGNYVNLPTATTYSANTWYKVEVAFDTANNKYQYIKIDDVTKASDVASVSQTASTYIRISSPTNVDFWFDKMYIRKYTPFEPQITIL